MKHFLTLLIIFNFFGCSKDRLTPATQTGANTFSCKIDGKVFKPSESGSSWIGANPLIVNNNILDGFILRARKFSTATTAPVNVLIKLPYLEKAGIYILSTYGCGQYLIDYAYGPVLPN